MTINLERCHLGEESDCLNEWGMRVIRAEPVACAMRVMHALDDRPIGRAELSRATLRGRRAVLVDRTTGQLYDANTLRCLSGPMFLADHE